MPCGRRPVAAIQKQKRVSRRFPDNSLVSYGSRRDSTSVGRMRKIVPLGETIGQYFKQVEAGPILHAAESGRCASDA
jgi:hypothetical protein